MTAAIWWISHWPSALNHTPPVRGRSVAWVLVVLAATLLLSALLSTMASLRVPGPTGSFAVGRLRTVWIDSTRAEVHTEREDDRRAVPVQVWFPAESGSGQPASYVENLGALADAFIASGELNSVQLFGLGWVRDQARVGARVAGAAPRYPVVLLSPGNVTNVAFYATIAEELASNGYVVVGVDHPYQVAAVLLPDGTVAAYDASADALPPGDKLQLATSGKIEERVADLRFVLDQLTTLTRERALLEGRLDLDRVGIMGHSNGGLAAAYACRQDARFRACVNIDGQQEGGPFAVLPGAAAPEQPFMFLTKETSLHPVLHRVFEAAGQGAYRVVIPSAGHGQFTDGALFEPTLHPFDHAAEDVLVAVRGFTRAFFELHLNQAPSSVLSQVPAPADVYVNVYPLGEHPPIPVR